MKNFVPKRLAELCGVLGAVGTALLLAWLQASYDWNPIGRMLWGFLPWGALLVGLFAAFGYAVGLLWQRVRPTRALRTQMVVVLGLTFFLIHWLGYQQMRVDGVPVPELVGFGTYLRVMLTESSLVFGGVFGTASLGPFGYLVAALQLVGFCAGGVGLYSILGNDASCPGCDRTFREPTATFSRRWSSAGDYAAFREQILGQSVVDSDYLALATGDYRVGDHVDAKRAIGWNSQACNLCGMESVVEIPRRRDGAEWQDDSALRRVLAVQPGLDVAGALQRADRAAYGE